MSKIQDDILSYREMCDTENVQTLQRGMNFHLNSSYSVILMSQRSNAPYKDRIHEDGITIEYEGHDVSKKSYEISPKFIDQSFTLPSGKETQNGLFKKAVDLYKFGSRELELVKVYEKIISGVWSMKGHFDLVDYKEVRDENRKVIRFFLKLSQGGDMKARKVVEPLVYSRLIPSEVKKDVWRRDRGKCVLCGDSKNLHFDHELPFSKGGTSLTATNVRILCMKHNLEKSGKIE